MDKSELCKYFIDQLTSWRIKHEVYNNSFNVQVQRIHNFYPSKRSYYNSETGEKCFYPEFKDGNDFLKWLSEKSTGEKQEPTVEIEYVLEYLDECDSLTDAIVHFHNLKNRLSVE